MTVKQLALHAISESLSGLAAELETLVAAAPAGAPPADSQALIEEARSVAKTLLTDGDTGGAENRAETLLRALEAAVEALKR